MRNHVVFVSVAWLWASVAAGAAPPPTPAGTLVLDESAYWRYYVEFGTDRLDPQALKAEGEKLLGRKGMARLKGMVRRWTRPPYVEKGKALDLGRLDWRDHAAFFVTQVANVGCNDERVSFHAGTPPAPAGWMGPGFDPAGWPRQRLPLLAGNIPPRGQMHGVGEMRQPLARGACFRTTFQVPDPTRTGRYTLRLTFRGGARVFVNGREVARSHLSDGRGEPYPKQAYLCLPDESEPRRRERLKRRTGGDYVDFCPDLPGKAGAPKDDQTYHRGVNRKGWGRITRLRNRVIGPVAIPPALLRQGANLLAVEVRASDLHPIVAGGKGMDWGRSYIMGAEYGWAHCRLLAAELRCTDPAAPSALARPAGFQVWTEDVHRRLYGPDFAEPSRRPRPVRIVAVINGTHAGQIAVAADRELSGLKAVASELRSPDGAAIGRSAITISYLHGHSVSHMVKLGQWRGLPEVVSDPVCPTSWMALLRHGPASVRAAAPPRDEAVELMKELTFFDHIRPEPPGRVPANTCQPIWISLKVPPDTPPGLYRGSIRIEAAGVKPATVPVEADVMAWHLPDPQHFQSFFAGEQSPYGVAQHYGCRLWSDEHFALMAPSFRQLARLGGRWVFVPVIHLTEFGNLSDSMIRWVRSADGRLSFDFTILDRYLDLATSHLGSGDRGASRTAGAAAPVICFVVSHGTGAGAPASVSVLDKSTGRIETLDLSGKSPDYRRNWQAFSAAVYAHMRSRGLADSLYWGFGWDGIGDPDLIPLLAESVPEAVRWARGSHAPNRAPGGWAGAFDASSFIYSVPITEDSARGWRRRDLFLLNPRAGCSVVSANGHSPPFPYRMLMNRALAAGCRGIARIGADYWDDVFYRGYSGRAWPGSLPGMGCLSLLWPGPGRPTAQDGDRPPAGAEPSQRGEILLEGIQEAEARIFLEQALERNALPDELAGRVREALARHHRQTLYMPVGRIGIQIQEYAAGWQARSQSLYAAAAEAAGAVPLDVGTATISRTVPARSRTRIDLNLRNWTPAARAWKAASDAPWLVPSRSEGKLLGHETLSLLLDAGKLRCGQAAEATVTVTDLSAAPAGRAHSVKVSVKVGEVLKFVVGPAYDYLGQPGHAASWGPRRIDDFATFNVPAAASERRPFVLTNLSGEAVAWKIVSGESWLSAAPASGRLAPGQRTTVTVTAAPPDRGTVTRETTLTVREAGGDGVRQEAKMVVHVIPPHRPPAALPTGQAVPLSQLPREAIKAHRSRAYWYGTSDPRRPDYGPKFDEEGNIPGGTPQLTLYDIEGKGFAAFSGRVRVNAGRQRVGESAGGKKVNFEVWVDGRLAAQSGLMTAGDPPRLLVADGLAGAKRLKLYARWDRPEPKYLGGTVGITWIEPRLHKAP